MLLEVILAVDPVLDEEEIEELGSVLLDRLLELEEIPVKENEEDIFVAVEELSENVVLAELEKEEELLKLELPPVLLTLGQTVF